MPSWSVVLILAAAVGLAVASTADQPPIVRRYASAGDIAKFLQPRGAALRYGYSRMSAYFTPTDPSLFDEWIESMHPELKESIDSLSLTKTVYSPEFLMHDVEQACWPSSLAQNLSTHLVPVVRAQVGRGIAAMMILSELELLPRAPIRARLSLNSLQTLLRASDHAWNTLGRIVEDVHSDRAAIRSQSGLANQVIAYSCQARLPGILALLPQCAEQ